MCPALEIVGLIYEEPPSKVTLTEGNILTLLPINGKKRKKRNRITPTLPSLLSSEEFGSASDKKSEENESDKKKVAKKLRREEKKTNNENAFIKLIQEMENIESHAHKDEHNGKKKGRKQTKKLTSINITQDRDSDANSAARKEMKEELAVNSDEALDYSDHQTNDSCLGCGQNYGGELLVQCEVCDSWWHKECTKTANNFNNKEQGFTFVCIQCCPDQLS
uniref:PHD-type domain-containing protein n=1 Tax=Biomphalaria glabrata TaxID=6526 RepID=A0A2C9L1F0_BIOGL